MNNAAVAVVGGINMDLFMEAERMPLPGESRRAFSLAKLPGGKGANTAIAAFRATHKKPMKEQRGKEEVPSLTNNRWEPKQIWAVSYEDSFSVRIYLNGAVGRSDSATLLDNLASNGIDISQVQLLDGEETATAVIVVETTSGENRCLAYLGATRKWRFPKGISTNVMCGGRRPDLIICHLSVPLSEILNVLAMADIEGVETILNPSPAEYLNPSMYKGITHLLMNETEAITLLNCSSNSLSEAGELHRAAQYFLECGVKIVVITLGDRGAYYATSHGEEAHIEAERDIHVLDTTGAGDMFIGAYGSEVIRQRRQGVSDIAAVVRRACKASARAIEHLGAQECMPWADEIK